MAARDTALEADHDSALLQQATDQIGARLRGESVGKVAAALAAHPEFRAIHNVPAFIEWLAREISLGRDPVLRPGTGPQHNREGDRGSRSRARRRATCPIAGRYPTTTWDDLLDHVLTHEDVEAFWQPIVDLRVRTVVGYEAFARFAGATGVPPDRWFMEAAKRGRRSELEALAVRAALRRLADAPRGCFLSLNVSPHALISAPVRRALFELPNLHGVAIELTSAARPADVDDLASRAHEIRQAGAMFGLTYEPGMTTTEDILALSPSVLKVAAPFVAEIRRANYDDESSAVLARLADPFGARIVVQNVERMHELLGLQQVGIRFVQGFLVGVPTTSWQPLASEIDMATPRVA